MEPPHQIIAGLTTKADRIRALNRAGMSRADIASFLGITYQHVRNTLVQSGLVAGRSSPAPSAATRVRREQWPLERLVEAGFDLLGDCAIFGEEAFGYSTKAPLKAGVYAFAVDGLVKYVGLTRGSLRTRLGHYVYGHKGQKTSARVKDLILNELRSGHRIQVLIASPPSFEWNGLPVDGAAGLETGLIRLIGLTGTNRVIEDETCRIADPLSDSIPRCRWSRDWRYSDSE